MEFCGSVSKFLLLAINILTFLAGNFVIGIGVFLMFKNNDFSEFFETLKNPELVQKISIASWIFIGAGIVISLVAFLGCCAVCCSNKCMMHSFAVLMDILLVAEFVGLFMLAIGDTSVLDEVMKKSLDTYDNGAAGELAKSFNGIQRSLECCGILNATDWLTIRVPKNSSSKFPESCCKDGKKVCGNDKIEPYKDVNKEGCISKVKSILEDNYLIVRGVGIGIAILQLFMINAACFFGTKMKRKGYDDVSSSD